MDKRLVAIFGVVLIFIISASILAGFQLMEGDSLGTVDVIVVDRNGSERAYENEFEEEMNALDFLKNLDESNEDFNLRYEENSEFGAYITSINGDDADPASEYWKFIVNGEDAQVGISTYMVMDEDQFQFEIEAFEF